MPACPQCKQPADLSKANAWRPFCSERCRLLDLGSWLDGRYAIPAEEADDIPGDNDDGGGDSEPEPH